jgi:hypothetical protein
MEDAWASIEAAAYIYNILDITKLNSGLKQVGNNFIQLFCKLLVNPNDKPSRVESGINR